jgi:hypothetical protein
LTQGPSLLTLLVTSEVPTLGSTGLSVPRTSVGHKMGRVTGTGETACHSRKPCHCHLALKYVFSLGGKKKPHSDGACVLVFCHREVIEIPAHMAEGGGDRDSHRDSDRVLPTSPVLQMEVTGSLR